MRVTPDVNDEPLRLRIEVSGPRSGFTISLADERLAGIEVELLAVPLLAREAVAEALREVAHRLDTGVGSADRP